MRGELLASSVMQALHWTTVVVAVYETMHVPISIYGRELWVMTERRSSFGSWLRWFWHLIRMPPGPLPSGHVQMEGCVWMVYIQRISSGLGTSLCSPRRSLIALLGRGMTGISCSACCHTTGSWISERKWNITEIMNNWTWCKTAWYTYIYFY